MTPNTTTTALAALGPDQQLPRLQHFMQNVSTSPLYVKRGAGASTTDYHFILNGTGADGSAGGNAKWDDYYGLVTVAGTNLKYLAWRNNAL